MIKTETITLSGKQFIRTYSDEFMIHGGNPESDYIEALDPADLNRTYTETDIPLPSADAEQMLSRLEAIL